MKKEFSILRKYLETEKMQPKCVIERSTLTELHDVTSRIDVILNNGQERDEGRAKPKQLVNDLKKPKNVNFSQVISKISKLLLYIYARMSYENSPRGDTKATQYK